MTLVRYVPDYIFIMNRQHDGHGNLFGMCGEGDLVLSVRVYVEVSSHVVEFWITHVQQPGNQKLRASCKLLN